MKQREGVAASVSADGTAATGTQLGSVAGERQWPPQLPKRLAPFAQDYERYVAGVVSDKGGIGNLSTNEIALLEATAEVRVLRRKIGRQILTRGVATRAGELRPAMKVYVALANTERIGLLALGLEKRARRVDSYLAETLERQRAAGAAPGSNGRNSFGDEVER